MDWGEGSGVGRLLRHSTSECYVSISGYTKNSEHTSQDRDQERKKETRHSGLHASNKSKQVWEENKVVIQKMDAVKIHSIRETETK